MSKKKEKKTVVDRVNGIKEWNEDAGHPIEWISLVILVIIGFFVQAQLAAVEGTDLFFFLYCVILYLLIKFGGRLKLKTVVAIVIALLVITYILTIIAMPELIHLH